MSTPLSPLPPEAPATPERAPGETLASLRAELDRLDDELHDALMRRAEVVQRVAALKGGVALRPGREAEIIRRLLARHRGALPPQTIVRIWRELLAGTTAIQGEFQIAVCDPDPDHAYATLAREHFGALTALNVHSSPAQAIADVGSGLAAAVVLPMPAEGEPRSQAWWPGLLRREQPRVNVVAVVPFWVPRPKGAPRVQAMIAAAMPPDPTEADRSLIGFEFSSDTSRAALISALTAAELSLNRILIRREPGLAAAQALVDVQGHVAEADPRLGRIGPALRRALVLGAYAIPVGGAGS